MSKVCSKCKVEKDSEAFSAQRSKKDGLRSWCRECLSSYSREYSARTVDAKKIREKARRTNNKEVEKARHKKYYEGNRVLLAAKQRMRREDNPSYMADWAKTKYATDINYKLMSCLRAKTRISLKGKKKPCSMEKNCGYEGSLMDHFETTFQPGMTRLNHGNKEGQWSIDHIKPLSWFDLTDPEQYKQANHYTNLKAMWHLDNVKKGNRYEG